jgi:signal transduction histidine kinase
LAAGLGARYNGAVSDVFSWPAAFGRIFDTIPDLASPREVQTSLRAILGDPSVELYWWNWESGRYVNVDGAPSTAVEGPGRVVTRIEYETRRIGLIAHDARLLEAPGFLSSFVPMMRIAMERDRLHRDLVAKLDLLKASRLRIVEAADEERRRLERNLHDGAQQRLVAARLDLRRLESRVKHDPELAELARLAREDLDGAIEDLRELARGLHPPLLAQRGLAAAVRAGAERSSLPVELDLQLEAQLPPAVEAAAYYVCAESVTNAVKHAQASTVWLSVVHAGSWLTVEVRDDGVGGASFDCEEATGLGGLRDRVETLDGTFEIESPPGAGTKVVAAFPLVRA